MPAQVSDVRTAMARDPRRDGGQSVLQGRTHEDIWSESGQNLIRNGWSEYIMYCFVMVRIWSENGWSESGQKIWSESGQKWLVRIPYVLFCVGQNLVRKWLVRKWSENLVRIWSEMVGQNTLCIVLRWADALAASRAGSSRSSPGGREPQQVPSDLGPRRRPVSASPCTMHRKSQARGSRSGEGPPAPRSSR